MRKKLILALAGLFLGIQCLAPSAATARPAKLEINNGLGISLFLIGSAVFGTVVAFSPKTKKGVTLKKKNKAGTAVEEKELKTAEEMKKELEDMRGR